MIYFDEFMSFYKGEIDDPDDCCSELNIFLFKVRTLSRCRRDYVIRWWFTNYSFCEFDILYSSTEEEDEALFYMLLIIDKNYSEG